ncbi:MAG: glycosyltransferase [bacterium]
MKAKKIAIVAEWLTSRGGAEYVVDSLLEAFPEADLFTTVFNEKKLPEYIKRNPKTSFLQSVPFSRSKHQSIPPLLLPAIKSLNLEGYDLIISSSSAIGKGINKPENSVHVCYCHTPMRYAWQSEIDDRLVSKPFGRFFLEYLKRWDIRNNKDVDFFLTNSKTVQKRIKKFYGRSSTVIYPPVNLLQSKQSKPGNYFISLGRLIPYKRTDLAILSCQKLGQKLLVAGDGEDLSSLEKIATKPTKFLGRISSEQKAQYLGSAKALIFPGEEDFGIVPIEALSCGTPVIAYAKGGASEYIINRKNGILFKEQNVESLIEAIEKFSKTKFDKKYIIKSAQKFAKECFKKEIKEFIERI